MTAVILPKKASIMDRTVFSKGYWILPESKQIDEKCDDKS